jgi:isocitrate/isopropylmalate dehydrogenase
LPAIDLLDAVSQKDQARRILQAVERVLVEGRVRTGDLGGSATTTMISDAIIRAL